MDDGLIRAIISGVILSFLAGASLLLSGIMIGKTGLKYKIFLWFLQTALLALIIYRSIEYGNGIIPSVNTNIFQYEKLEVGGIYEVAGEVEDILIIKQLNGGIRAYRFPEKPPAEIFKVTGYKDGKYTWEAR